MILTRHSFLCLNEVMREMAAISLLVGYSKNHGGHWICEGSWLGKGFALFLFEEQVAFMYAAWKMAKGGYCGVCRSPQLCLRSSIALLADNNFQPRDVTSWDFSSRYILNLDKSPRSTSLGYDWYYLSEIK